MPKAPVLMFHVTSVEENVLGNKLYLWKSSFTLVSLHMRIQRF